MFHEAETEAEEQWYEHTVCSLLLSPSSKALEPLHSGRFGCSSSPSTGAACTGSIMRGVLEEKGYPLGLKLEPQLSKWLRGQHSASP